MTRQKFKRNGYLKFNIASKCQHDDQDLDASMTTMTNQMQCTRTLRVAVSRPTPSPRQIQLLSIAPLFPLPLNPLAHTLRDIVRRPPSLAGLRLLLAQHRILRDNTVQLRNTREHVLAALHPALSRERRADLPHLLDPAVCFGWHGRKGALGTLEGRGGVFLQMRFQVREDIGGGSGGEGEDGEGGGAFAERGEAGFECAGGADFGVEDLHVQRRDEGGGEEGAGVGARDDDAGQSPGAGGGGCGGCRLGCGWGR